MKRKLLLFIKQYTPGTKRSTMALITPGKIYIYRRKTHSATYAILDFDCILLILQCFFTCLLSSFVSVKILRLSTTYI